MELLEQWPAIDLAKWIEKPCFFNYSYICKFEAITQGKAKDLINNDFELTLKRCDLFKYWVFINPQGLIEITRPKPQNVETLPIWAACYWDAKERLKMQPYYNAKDL